MANDSISMRGVTRLESSTPVGDVSQLLGQNKLLAQNQSVTNILSADAESGFRKVLETQVSREPVAPTSERRGEAVSREDKARRLSGNNSPQTRNVPSQNRKDTDRRSESSADASMPRRTEVDVPHKSKITKAKAQRDEEIPAATAAQTQDPDRTPPPVIQDAAVRSTEGKVTEASAELTLSAGSDQPIVNDQMSLMTATDVGPSPVAGEGLQMPVIELMTPLNAAAETLDPERLLGLMKESQMGAAIEPSVPAGVAKEDGTLMESVLVDSTRVDGSLVGSSLIDSSLLDGSLADRSSKVNSLLGSALADEMAVDVPPDVLATSDIFEPSLAASAPAVVENAVSTVVTGTSEAKSFDADAPSEKAPGVELSIGGDSENSPVANEKTGITDDIRGATLKAAWAGPRVTGEPRAQEGVLPDNMTPEAESVIEASYSVEDAQPTSAVTNEKEEPLFALQDEGPEIENENNEEFLADDDMDAAISAEIPDIRRAPEKDALMARSVAVAVPEGEEPVEAAETETAPGDNWSILDAIDDSVATDTKTRTDGPKQPPLQIQNEQQMAFVRNELRNLERLVDANLQSSVSRSARDTSKDDKSSDIKPASLTRAIETFSGTVKAADVRSTSPALNTPVAFGRSGFAEQMAEKIVMMTTQKVQVAEIRLDPKELGTVEIKIRVHQDQASVVFSSPHAQVRDALETSIPRLREMFADAGVGLGSVNVNDRGTNAGGGGSQDSQRGESSGIAGNEEITDERATRPARKSNGLVDYYA